MPPKRKAAGSSKPSQTKKPAPTAAANKKAPAKKAAASASTKNAAISSKREAPVVPIDSDGSDVEESTPKRARHESSGDESERINLENVSDENQTSTKQTSHHDNARPTRKSGDRQTLQTIDPNDRSTWTRNPADSQSSQSEPGLSTQTGISSEMVDVADLMDDIEARDLRPYGTIDTKVVGVRYYKGVATSGEWVSVRREPSNPYDKNAIRIDNVAGNQIGHINRNMAEKLSPFLDDGSIIVEATLDGDLGYFDGPLEIRMYGTSAPEQVNDLKKRLQVAKLPVNEFIKEEKERKKREKERIQEEKIQQRAREQEQRRMLKEAAGSSVRIGAGSPEDDQEPRKSSQWTNRAATHANAKSGPSLDSIIESSTDFDPRALNSVTDKYGAGEEALAKLPLADQPKDVLTTLLPYQLQGLAWLLDRESPQLPDKSNNKDSVQLWKRLGSKGYTNLATNFTTAQPTLASGGILADDMGLGKTIQMIALMVADPRRKKNKNPTLVVAPLSVMSNWSNQAAAHVRQENGFKTLIYHGANKTKQTAKELAEYDLVVTTYQTMALEYMPAGSKSDPKPVPRPHGLFSIPWRRVVLDEGHHIRNPKSKMAQAAYALLGESRWVLTGTPIVNNLRDLQSHVRFVGLTGGLEQPSIFSSVLIRPLQQGHPNANVLLQALMSTICLRRMKDMKCVDIKLPSLSSHKYTVTFTNAERERYDVFSQEAKGALHEFQNRQGEQGGQTFSHLLEVLLRMRQACNHYKLCGERVAKLMAVLEKEKKVKPTPANLKALQDLLKLNIDSHEDCPICLEVLHNPCITRCGHHFGGECIERVIETQHKCPMCRAELESADELVRPKAEFGDSRDDGDEEIDGDDDPSSTKIKALLDILNATRKKDSTVKTVIFSQWTSFLDIVGEQVSAAGMQYCRLDGTMNAAKRDEAIEALAENPACTVMLASLGVCSVGLNLVAASQVILMDSWWAPAIEDQAIDRVYRLGQTRPVNVFRLVMEDSIEDRVLELQQDKRKLAMKAFGEKTMKRGKEQAARLADIQRLLG